MVHKGTCSEARILQDQQVGPSAILWVKSATPRELRIEQMFDSPTEKTVE
jgi:hypothetical protein